jgi:pyrimidine and pyridine-specific 5'-nucleotidase
VQIYISTHDAEEPHGDPRERASTIRSTASLNEDDLVPISKQTPVYYDTAATDMKGAWSALATPENISDILASQLSMPKGFPGLASPAMNPMSMALSHEEIVVGCADGTI